MIRWRREPEDHLDCRYPSPVGGVRWSRPEITSNPPRDRKLVNQWASDHFHTLAGATPILALDMYEHSYHIDFGAKAAGYVETFMQAIRWANAGRLFAELGTRGRSSGR